MKEYIIELITTYGVEPILFAVVINILTSVIKLPIKKLAKKLSDSTKVTRFIVLLPILLGFGAVCLYYELFMMGISFTKEFLTLWITSTSLSLTFYAIYEKLFPSSKNKEKSIELKTTEKILDELREFFDEFISCSTETSVNKKIVLKGKNEGGEH